MAAEGNEDERLADTTASHADPFVAFIWYIKSCFHTWKKKNFYLDQHFLA